MGRKPKKSRHPKSLHDVTVRITGERKNLLINHAEKMGLSLSEFINWVIWDYCQREKGLEPAPAEHPKPTQSDLLRSYLSGERILMPCGKSSCEMKPIVFGEAEYCETCSLRIY
jgi:hypothetical protein